MDDQETDQETSSKNKNIEGLDDTVHTSLGEYPIDTVLIRHETRTIHDALRRINQDAWILNPDFQRDFIWSEKKQSRLIESVLMRLPLPVFYLAENKDGKMAIVDGLQRLSTFLKFSKNKLKLHLTNKTLNGLQFNTLDTKLQNRFEDCNLIFYSIDSKVPPRALLDIFERVNSGEPLSRQQMRNCLKMGESTRFLKEMVDTDIFKEATGGALSSKTMRDREMVNRFCAFKLLGYETYQSMDDHLSNALDRMNEHNFEIESLKKGFIHSMKMNRLLFGNQAFRKPRIDGERRSMFNASLWDVMSAGLSDIQESSILSRKECFVSKFSSLFEGKHFMDAITLGTSQINRVRYRFEKMNSLIKEVFL